MRRLRLNAGPVALLALISLLVSSCAGERPTLQADGASREVDSIDASVGAGDDDNEDDSSAQFEHEDITLRLGLAAEWTGDPADAGPASLSRRVVADLLHGGLTQLQADGSIGAGLAERWFVTEDRLTWTFALPDGLVDGAGEALTARDIKLSLESVAARGPADQAATSLIAVRGWVDYMNGDSGGVAGISAPDQTTLVIRLDTPYELLPNVLASPAFGISGLTDDGDIRTTGKYRYGDDDDTLIAVDDDAVVSEIKLIRADSSPIDLLSNGVVDWVVLPSGQGTDNMPGDIIRQPLDLRVAFVARLGDVMSRRAVLGSIVSAELTRELVALNPLPNALAAQVEPNALPASITIDVPEGPLAALGAEAEEQLDSLGVDAELRVSSAEDFAALVASGQAVLFPLVVAGGSGAADAILRIGAGGVDDPAGDEFDEHQELVDGIAAEQDSTRRQILIDGFVAELQDAGLLLMIGQFEVRVGIGPDYDGLRHRPDGTLDLDRLSSGS